MPTVADVKWVHKGMRTGGLIGGVAGGAAGAVGGFLPKTYKNDKGKNTKKTVGQRIAKGILLGGAGAYAGRAAGMLGVGIHRAHKVINKGYHATAAKPAHAPDWLKGAKTKAEGRRAYHAQARKAHPDLGGSEEAIKKLTQEWESHEPHFKTAMYAAFADELEKIAGLGAYVGGAAGWSMSPNTVKGKLVGTAGGALAGHLIGGAAKATKQTLWDEQQAREREALHGYQPSAGQQPGAPTNFY